MWGVPVVRWVSRSLLLPEGGWLCGFAGEAVPEVGLGVPCGELLPVNVQGKRGAAQRTGRFVQEEVNGYTHYPEWRLGSWKACPRGGRRLLLLYAICRQDLGL